MLKGDEVAPFDLERKLRARYTLLGVHNIVLFAMAGIDMAAWDALGQSLGQPLVRLLGAAPRPIPAYNSKGLGIHRRQGAGEGGGRAGGGRLPRSEAAPGPARSARRPRRRCAR